MTSQSEQASPAPLRRLVGQLRELLGKVTPGPWRVLPCDNGFAVAGGIVKYDRDDAGDINGPIGNKSNAEAIVAAINALPALLAIAEAAADYEAAGWIALPGGISDPEATRLRNALRMLPNAKDQPAGASPARSASPC